MKVLHLGLGRFHRAHQAWYFDRLNETESKPWQISAWSMRSPKEAEKLKALGFKYSHLTVGEKHSETRTIRSITEAGWAIEERSKLLERFLDPDLRWITLTVTEKGYHLKSGNLDLEDPSLQSDLQNPESPQTTIGILAWGLRNRLKTHSQPIAVMSCDNIASNGEKLRRALLEFTRASGTRIDLETVDFPNTMVDRIVPAGSEKEDELIVTEPFSQWIIEEHFRGERPALEKVGVTFTKSVKPYEERKLRLLNASHSLLAYGGLLNGHRYVHEAIADEELRAIVQDLYSEVQLRDFSQEEHEIYTRSLLERFSNSKLPYELRQIAMDGSKKLPERIFPSLEAAEANQTPHYALDQCLDFWTEFLWKGLQEKLWSIDDPMAEEFTKLLDPKIEIFRKRVLSALGVA